MTRGFCLSVLPLLVMGGLARRFDDPGLAPARLHSSVSVDPNLVIAEDAFRARFALLQRVVPFDVARVRHPRRSLVPFGSLRRAEMPNRRPIARQM
jgi:hypothetical protein